MFILLKYLRITKKKQTKNTTNFIYLCIVGIEYVIAFSTIIIQSLHIAMYGPNTQNFIIYYIISDFSLFFIRIMFHYIWYIFCVSMKHFQMNEWNIETLFMFKFIAYSFNAISYSLPKTKWRKKINKNVHFDSLHWHNVVVCYFLLLFISRYTYFIVFRNSYIDTICA